MSNPQPFDIQDEARAIAAGQHLHRMRDGQAYSHTHPGWCEIGHDHLLAHLTMPGYLLSAAAPVIAPEGAIWYDGYDEGWGQFLASPPPTRAFLARYQRLMLPTAPDDLRVAIERSLADYTPSEADHE